jgi:hypothetical protein
VLMMLLMMYQPHVDDVVIDVLSASCC